MAEAENASQLPAQFDSQLPLDLSPAEENVAFTSHMALLKQVSLPARGAVLLQTLNSAALEL